MFINIYRSDQQTYFVMVMLPLDLLFDVCNIIEQSFINKCMQRKIIYNQKQCQKSEIHIKICVYLAMPHSLWGWLTVPASVAQEC